MDGEAFLKLAEGLTGTPVKDVTDSDRAVLDALLADDARKIDHSQLNELLLLVNKDRVERPFFDWFLGPECCVGTIAAGVVRFQKIAMLCYGNFIFAYRTLSRLRSVEELKRELGESARDQQEMVTHFSSRSSKLVDVVPIARSETPLVGYLSAGEIIAESERVK